MEKSVPGKEGEMLSAAGRNRPPPSGMLKPNSVSTHPRQIGCGLKTKVVPKLETAEFNGCGGFPGDDCAEHSDAGNEAQTRYKNKYILAEVLPLAIFFP